MPGTEQTPVIIASTVITPHDHFSPYLGFFLPDLEHGRPTEFNTQEEMFSPEDMLMLCSVLIQIILRYYLRCLS